MSTRDFKTAAKLFLEAVPTFSSYELFTYEELVFYSVITSMLGGCDFFFANGTFFYSTRSSRTEKRSAKRLRNTRTTVWGRQGWHVDFGKS
jgi:hypothetical protein